LAQDAILTQTALGTSSTCQLTEPIAPI